MDLLFELLGLFFVLMGIIGSFLPVLPGPITGWVGLFLLHQSSRIADNSTFLTITFIVALSVFLLDYIIPALGTKKFGGSKKGIIGSTIGLLVGLVFFGPLGIIIGPFAGAYVGERLNRIPNNLALKAAFGSLVGFLSGVFLKFSVAAIFCYYFIRIYWTVLI